MGYAYISIMAVVSERRPSTGGGEDGTSEKVDFDEEVMGADGSVWDEPSGTPGEKRAVPQEMNGLAQLRPQCIHLTTTSRSPRRARRNE